MSKRSSRQFDKEQQKIDQLRSRLQDVIKPEYEDSQLRKWLKARNFDLDKAELMFRNNVAYREKMNVESLLDYDPPEAIPFFGKVSGTAGPMARDLDGLVQMMRAILCDYHFELDPYIPPIPFRDEIFESKRQLRVGFYVNDGYIPVVPACGRAVMMAKRALEQQGHTVINNYLTGGFCGHDKEGSPVRIELFGHLDIKGIMASVRKSDLEKTKLMQCEWTVQEWQRLSEVMGRPVDGLTVIFDMDAVTTKMMWRPGLKMYLHLVKILEDNYPEMMKRLLVINAPMIFPILYKLCRPLISDEMRNKIHVLGTDYRQTLLKYIDDNQLPEFLGGILTDPDGNPRLPSKICQGGEVPERYFFDNNKLCEHMKTATIQPGHKLIVDFVVTKPGSILRWEFKTEDYDISFGVVMKEKTKAYTSTVVPTCRVNSHLLAQDGSVTCEKVGTYYLVFDNSFSWTRSKHIYYDGDISYIEEDYVRSEINDLVEEGEWGSMESKFEHVETTNL